MIEQQLIQKSSSLFSLPVLLVKKKDETWQFVVDYGALKAITVKDKFPIPTVDELFDELGGSKYFSKLDLLSGYHQIKVKKEDVSKTAFRTYEGHYEFGQTNALSTFQATMNGIFQPYLRKPSRIRERVSSRPKQGGGNTKLTDSHFDKGGGGISWNCRPQFNTMTLAAPLTDLLKKGEAFEWTKAAHHAYEQLKTRLRFAPILQLPCFDKLFFVETDASGVGIGAVLTQENRPLAYFSQKSSARSVDLPPRNKSLRELTQQTIQTPEQQQWLSKLIGYDFEIRYRPRKLNSVPDALSRETNAMLMAMSKLTLGIIDDIRKASEHDEEQKETKAQIQQENSEYLGESLEPAGLLQPLPIPDQVFEDIAMDFIAGLPKSNCREAILVVVDRLTKYGYFFALPKQFDGTLIAKVLVHGFIKLHGIPQSIVSDRDRILCSAGNEPSKWESYLAWAEYWYNTAYQVSAGMTPFKALYGRDPPTTVDYLEGSSNNLTKITPLLLLLEDGDDHQGEGFPNLEDKVPPLGEVMLGMET
ncbi:hypothetical protein F3Y22_tig00112508pilonHSYRG00008 [Hibiscus syriacus]|uniref:Integrase catalytic domain-containing protein n=1 Tax=Hibiscus syriacus TaxID=106335 RepID=A0A6A2Y8H5_HIBSY|nr:hypothetical protein F3Y22_tig00112508pilonHSYRG00008 [Hibiscus syriacus]